MSRWEWSRRRGAGLPLTLLAAIVSATPAIGRGSAHATRSSCDPDLSAVDTAIKSRNAGKPTDADKVLQDVLARHPDNFRAQYVMGTVLIQQGATDRGLGVLKQAEQILWRQPEPCAVSFGWYSIYNTLGAQYYKQRDRATALKYYEKGYAHINDMLPNTKQELLNNLGLFYFTEGDTGTALKYYTAASAAGDKNAKVHIAAINSIVALRSSKPR